MFTPGLNTKVSLNLNKTTKKENIIVKDTLLIFEDTKEIEKNVTEYFPDKLYKATWYSTKGSRVHRDYPTAAYNKFDKAKIINGEIVNGTLLRVINVRTGDTCIVEITDRMECQDPNRIDLSVEAFGKLDIHSRGIIDVRIEKI